MDLIPFERRDAFAALADANGRAFDAGRKLAA